MTNPLEDVRAAAEAKAAALVRFEESLRAAVKVHTLAEVAQAAGLTRGRVSQIVGPVGRPAGRPARATKIESSDHADGRRARLEDALRLLEDRAGDAGVVEIVALLDEAESLREALEAESEAARGF